MSEHEKSVNTSGNTDDEEVEDGYPYQLIKFETTNKKGEAHIDCVPSTWVSFDIRRGKCECKFPPPPYNKDKARLLDDFVKTQELPPPTWPSYPVILRGHAKNYDEAIERLETLRTQEYAYTTEDGVSKANKAEVITKSYRQKIVKRNSKSVKKLN